MQQEVSVSMFEKLLSLLLHAKGGAVATVLVLGASGALVTATVENGLTTVTITQPSTASNTTTGGSTSTTTTTADPVILALFNNTKKEGSTEPATGNGCSDAAHLTNTEVKAVNDGFKKDHAAVQALSKDAAKTDENKKLVKDADNKIKGFRQEAVKAIHELFKSDECKGNDDEDNDEDNDDEDSTTGTTNGTTSTTTTTTTVAISGTDAKAIADAAIKAMDDEVANLKTKLETPAAAPATTNTNVAPGKSDKGRDNHDNKGKGKGHD
jgi:hypothetical protein